MIFSFVLYASSILFKFSSEISFTLISSLHYNHFTKKRMLSLYAMRAIKYSHLDHLIDEYIDLAPILDHLVIDKDKFLRPIHNVEVSYD